MAPDGVYGDIDATGICGQGQTLQDFWGTWSKIKYSSGLGKAEVQVLPPKLILGILATPVKTSHSLFLSIRAVSLLFYGIENSS